MTSLFDFHDYKAFVLQWVRSMPRNGRGQFRKMAEFLGLNSVVISQIFRADRHLTPEQALELADYLGLSASEAEYFVLLVQKDRAGSHRLRTLLTSQIEQMQMKGRELKARMPKDLDLSDEAKAVFYSAWYYSCVRLLTSIEKYQDIDSIASHLNLDRGKVKSVVEFLLEHGLCVRHGARIQMGPKRTHLGSDSPLIARHHNNWRLKGFARMDHFSSEELFFTGPMALSKEAAREIRKELLGMIRKFSDIAVASESETTACLNIDWFYF